MHIPLAAAATAVFLAACSASGVDRSSRTQIAGPSARAFAYVVVSVSDMQEALDLWERRLGMEIALSRRGADPGLSRIWGLEHDAIAEQVLLNTPGVIDGGVHLVRFVQPGEAVREGAAPRDLGPRSVSAGVRDLDARLAGVLAAGGTVVPDAASDRGREAPRSAGVRVHDAVEIALQTAIGSTVPLSKSGYAVALRMTAIVPDLEREAAFFADVLGLATIEATPAGAAAGGVRLMGARDNPFGRIELVEDAGAQARDLYARTVPPARGLLSVTYVVPDLAPILARGRTAGMADHGAVRTLLGEGPMASVTSPAGLRIDFVQL